MNLSIGHRLNLNSTKDFSLKDYYPFGMVMPGRNFNTENYRFGYGDQEVDNEIKGIGNSIDYGERMLDVRLGRWGVPDKFAAKYPAWSSYSGMMNNPLVYIDINGDSIELIIGRPYTDANGIEHPYGHAALRVFNAAQGYDMVFDFGRYGADWPVGRGEGILNVYSSSENYLKSEMLDRSSIGYMQPATVEQDRQVLAFFQSEINEGSVFRTGAVPGGGGTAFKLPEDYSAFSNNCLTLSCEALDIIGMNWLGEENDPRDALKSMEANYQSLRLTRTEYIHGSTKGSITWSPASITEIDFSDFNIIQNYVVPQDVLKPQVKPLPSIQPQ